MKKTLFYIFAALYVTCCSPSEKSEQVASVAVSAETLDLAKLSFNQNLPELMNNLQIKSEQVTVETTLYNLKIFKTGNLKAMQFAGRDLSGGEGERKNHILFHYDASDKKLVLYELTVYSADQIKDLEKEIGKQAVSVYQKAGTSKGAGELDENGNEIRSTDKNEYHVWEDKKTGLSYFLSVKGEGSNLSAELTVLDPSTSSGKDWIKARSLDWYKQ